MKTVYFPGCWDLLHVGHLRALKAASKLGSLIVGVADKGVVEQDKGREPIIPTGHRMEMLESFAFVARVEAYHELDFLPHLNWFKPDILAVSTQWGTEKRHRDAEEWCAANNCEIVRIPYTECVSTTDIKRRCYNQIWWEKAHDD